MGLLEDDRLCLYGRPEGDPAVRARLHDEVCRYLDQGFLGMKTKVGGLSLSADLRRVAGICQESFRTSGLARSTPSATDDGHCIDALAHTHPKQSATVLQYSDTIRPAAHDRSGRNVRVVGNAPHPEPDCPVGFSLPSCGRLKPTANGLTGPMAAGIIRSGPHPTRIDMSATTFEPNGTATGLLAPFPDPPTRHPDEMSSHRHLSERGAPYLLNWHFANPDTTLITAELYIAPEPRSGIKGLRVPDLMIAFDVDPEACYRSNAYIISEQGKPPDFVLEVASRSTGRIDVRDKPADYAALGIPEYWRFDETGEHHGQRLAGDRLVGDRYEPIEITERPDGSLEGYSEVLELYLRWEDGWLQWHDLETGRAIMNLAEMQRIAEEERQGRLEERQGRLEEQKARLEERQGRLEEQKARLEAEQRAEEAERREETERQARLDAERSAAERIRELEAKLHRRGP